MLDSQSSESDRPQNAMPVSEICSLIEYWSGVGIQHSPFHSDDINHLNRCQHKLPPGRAPEPWFGIPTSSSVFYLTLNPGHRGLDDSETGPVWSAFCYDMILERISYERYQQEATKHAIDWFRRAHGGFADRTFGN